MNAVFDFHTLIWVLAVILLVIWFVGLIRRNARRFIHLFLIVAVLLLLYNLFFH